MQITKRIIVASALVAALGLGACKPGTSGDRLSDIKNTTWKVEGIPKSVNATIAFGSDGTVTGFAGCNRYFATYTSDAKALSISAIGSTKKLCPPAEMSVEHELLKSLAVVDTWHGTPDAIELTAPVDKTTVRLARERNE